MHNRAAVFSVENPADTSIPPEAGSYTYYTAKRGRPGWFPKAAPVRGLYFLVHLALQALGLSCAQPPAHKAVVLQGKPAAPLCQQVFH